MVKKLANFMQILTNLIKCANSNQLNKMFKLWCLDQFIVLSFHFTIKKKRKSCESISFQHINTRLWSPQRFPETIEKKWNCLGNLAEQMCVNCFMKTRKTGRKSFKSQWKLLTKYSNNNRKPYQSSLVMRNDIRNDQEQKINYDWSNNKDTRPSFWCLYYQLWTYFTPFSSVSNADFEQVNPCWRRVK